MHLIPNLSARSIATIGVVTLLCGNVIACGEKPNNAQATAANKNAAGGTSGTPSGQRTGRSVVLAPTDIGKVERRSINSAIDITGTLRPIDNVSIRARVDGQLEGVYVREGQPVQAGQLLARFESVEQQSNSASAKAGLAAAQSELSTIKWNREQTEELFKAGAVPEREVRAAQQEEKAAQAKVSAAEAVLRSASLTERDTRVTAPVSGIIDTRSVENGEHVARGAVLFTLVRNTILELAAAVPERNASSIIIGQRVTFTSDGRTFEGKVSRVSPTIDPANRTITVYVDIPNPRGMLKGGSFATGSVISRTVQNTMVIPSSALRQNPDGSRFYVYRVSNGVIKEVDVRTGIVNDRDQIAEIIDGLSEGDQVITGNMGTLSDGMQAQIIGRDSAQQRR